MTMKKIVAAVVFVAFALPFVSFAQSLTTAQIQAQINSLLAEIQALQKQLVQLQGTSSCHSFQTNLGIGSSGDEVSFLLGDLMAEGLIGTRSSNFSSSYDEILASAVSAFQEKYRSEILTPVGLSAGTGFAGPATRAKLNSLYGCGTGTGTGTGSNAGTLSVVLNGAFASGSVIAGTTNAKIGSFVLSGNNSESVMISSLTIQAGQNASMFQNLRVMANGVQFGTVQGVLANGANYAISGNSLSVSANGSVVLDVYADALSSGLPGSVNMTTLAACSGVGQSTNAAYFCSSATGQSLTIIQSGTPYPIPSITVLSPNGGENFVAGQTYNISWKSSNVDTVSLSECANSNYLGYICRALGGASTNVKASLGNFSWYVDPNDPYIPGSAKIRVSQFSPVLQTGSFAPAVAIYDESDNFFQLSVAKTSSAGVLSVSQNGDLSSGSVIAGSPSAKIGSYVVNNPTSETVNMNAMTIGAGQNASSFQNLKLMANGLQFGTTQGTLANSGQYIFSGSVQIPANGRAVVDIYADVLSSGQPGSTNTTNFAGCSGVGQSSATAFTCNSAGGQTFTITTLVSSISVTQNSGLASGSVVIGSAGANIGSYVLSNPTSEQISVSNVAIQAGPNSNLFQNLAVYVGGTQFGITQGVLASNLLYNISGNPFTIPARGTVVLDLRADVLSSDQAGSTNTTTFAGCSATGQSSNSFYSCNSQSGQTFTVVRLVITTNVPSISSFNPSSAPVGATVVITGTGFTSTGNYINFGGYGIQNTLATNNGTTLTFSVPPVAVGSQSVSVTTNGGMSQAVNFIVTQPGSSLSVVQNPAFTSPTYSPGSAQVKIGSFTVTNPSSELILINSATMLANSYSPIVMPMPIQNMKILINGVQAGQTQGTISPLGSYVFSLLGSSGRISIPAGGTLVIDVYGDISSAMPSGTTYYSYSPVSLTGITGVGTVSTASVGFTGLITGQSVVVSF